MYDEHDETDSLNRPPTIVPGERVIMQLRHPHIGHPDPETDETVWHLDAALNAPGIHTVREPDQCWPVEPEPLAEDYDERSPHAVTVCRDCIDSWFRDYRIELYSESVPPVS